MLKRKRGKTNFHLLSRWTRRRYLNNADYTDRVYNSSSSDSDYVKTSPSCSYDTRKDDESFPGPTDSNRPINNSQTNSQHSIDDSTEISSCPDVNHITSTSEGESEKQISNSESEAEKSCYNSDFNDDHDDNEVSLGSNPPDTESEQRRMLTFLQSWGVDHGIPQNAFDALLLGLREHSCFSYLPRCSRTILKTPRTLNKTQVAPGEYIHLGVEFQLQKMLQHVPLHSVYEICLVVNIDGLPPYKSCQGELYPILISVLNVPEVRNKVVPVGIYYGPEKPENISDYLASFVSETKSLIENGIVIQNKNLAIKVSCFCMDAPAKSFVLGIIGHGGFYSCTKCKVKGATVEKKRVFEELNCEKRTHIDFIEKTDKHYQTGHTPLTEIPGIHFVDSFVLDYMHLVCLGVVRTLLFIWNCGTKSSKRSRLSTGGRKIISKRLLEFKTNVPSEFARKPREMKLILRWKATEFRTFLLYLGPVALKGVLDSEKYVHFLTLHSAMTILLSPSLCNDVHLRSKARLLLIQFVKSASLLYGPHLITHNFHGLIHLVDDADNFVSCKKDFSLNDISAFPFENFLQKIKQMLRGRNKPLEQIGRRLAEKYCVESHVTPIKQASATFPTTSEHQNGPLLALCSNPQYSTVIFTDFKISTKKDSLSDRYCGTDKGEIIQMHNIAFCKENKCMVVIGKQFIDKINFYSILSPENRPIVSSSQLGIYKVQKLSSWSKWPVTKITKKYMCIPYKTHFIVFPLLHSLAT